MGQTSLDAVFAMLDKCAPGHQRNQGTHFWTVMYRGRTFPNLPKGGHDSKGEIQIPKVEKLVRHLEIDKECARRMIAGLRFKSQNSSAD